MPDFEDPVTLTEDIIIYFDDIELTKVDPPGKECNQPAAVWLSIPIRLRQPLTLDNLQNANRIVISNVIGQPVITKNNLRESN
jgi:hypothetical protein